jgi:hypothetical protein
MQKPDVKQKPDAKKQKTNAKRAKTKHKEMQKE